MLCSTYMEKVSEKRTMAPDSFYSQISCMGNESIHFAHVQELFLRLQIKISDREKKKFVCCRNCCRNFADIDQENEKRLASKPVTDGQTHTHLHRLCSRKADVKRLSNDRCMTSPPAVHAPKTIVG